jgi:hypothetical protein
MLARLRVTLKFCQATTPARETSGTAAKMSSAVSRARIERSTPHPWAKIHFKGLAEIRPYLLRSSSIRRSNSSGIGSFATSSNI